MKHLFVIVISILVTSQLNAQDVTGSWLGSVTMSGVSLHLGFNLKKTSDTSLTATFDSPDQKAFGIACGKTYRIKDSLFINIPVINAKYAGLWDDKDNISGTFKQGTVVIILNLNRVAANTNAEAAKPLIRPQTPKPPFNYYSEDVEYDNADKSLHYGATFTRPSGAGKYPAVIIITGSGTQDRDGTMMGHKLYYVLADYLTRNGIAVLRVDDRGAGKSTVGSAGRNVNSVDFSYDVEASLNYLESRPDVNKKHLGLIGHSEGGIIAPMVAARRRDVSFIVLWGAPEIGGIATNTEQNITYGLKKAGADSSAIKAYAELNNQMLGLFASSPDEQTLDSKITVAFEDWKKNQSQQVLQSMHAANLEVKAVIAQYNGLYEIPWFRFFMTYNPEKDLSRVKCSVLAVNGEKDTQVNAAENLKLINKILASSGNKDFETRALPGLNHFLQTAKTGDVSEYETIEETMSPSALNIICSWIKLHTK